MITHYTNTNLAKLNGSTLQNKAATEARREVLANLKKTATVMQIKGGAKLKESSRHLIPAILNLAETQSNARFWIEAKNKGNYTNILERALLEYLAINKYNGTALKEYNSARHSLERRAM